MFDFALNTSLALDVNEVCFGEKPISLILLKNQQKIKTLLNGTDVVTVGHWTKKIERLCCHEVEAVKYFELLGKRYGDTNAVT